MQLSCRFVALSRHGDVFHKYYWLGQMVSVSIWIEANISGTAEEIGRLKFTRHVKERVSRQHTIERLHEPVQYEATKSVLEYPGPPDARKDQDGSRLWALIDSRATG